jgi:hypothetical protein
MMAKLQRETSKVEPVAEASVDDGLFGGESAESASEIVEPFAEAAPEVSPEIAVPEGFSGFFPEPPDAGRYSKEPPYDHAPVLLTDGRMERGVVGQWQVTRRWDGSKKRWGSVGFWALRATGGRPVGFTPTGWRVWRD